MRQKIKVGLLCDLASIKKWEADLLNYFISDEYYDVTLLKLHLEHRQTKKTIKSRIKNLPYLVAFKVEYFILKLVRNINYLDRIGFSNHYDNEHNITGFQEGVKTYLNLNQIDGYFDYLIRVNGVGILVIPQKFSTPILSLHHGDMYSNRGGPAGFWEIFFNQKETVVSLQRLTNDLDKGDLLFQYYCKTINYSFVLNQCNIYSVSSRVFDIYFKYEKQTLRVIEVTPILLSIPNFFIILNYYLIILRNLFLKINALNQKWVVCIEENGKRRILKAKDNSWYADPFFLNNDTIVVEKYLNTKKKGILVSINIKTQEEIFLLEEPFHLSHPFVFEENNRVFVIPESLEGNAIKLYELSNNQLNFIKDLLSGRYIDSLIFKSEKGYYLLTTYVDPWFNEEKRLYFSPDILAVPFIEKFDFIPITNPSVSRSAGVFKMEENYIVNYCQNPFPFYGRSINVCKLSFNGHYEIMYKIEIDSLKYKGIHHLSNIKDKLTYDLRIR